VTNARAQLVRFLTTPANVADNNPKVLGYLLKGLEGKCYGDKGYLSFLLGELLEEGLHLVAKVRRNMKAAPHPAGQTQPAQAGQHRGGQ